MAAEIVLQPEHRISMRHWEQNAPWIRRFSMRIGLEGKLILCFMSVMCAALSVTCAVFVHETENRLSDIMGEQARQVATALSTTSERLASDGEWESLNRRAQELIKGRNIPFVGYFNAAGQPVTVASRDVDFGLTNLSFDSRLLMQVTRIKLPAIGECLQVTSPIFSIPPLNGDPSGRIGPRLLGYVTVGVSQAREEAQIYRVQYLVIGIACVMVVMALPLAILLIHRVFFPIRALVAVTQQIIRGNLDARVEIHRPDAIGDLARCFDEMASCVKRQQQDLADANHDLERKVETRTAQLETANHRLTSEIAEKEEFLRAISHDLNAPLRNIGGMVTMLLGKHGEAFDNEVVHRLERIKSNVEVETDLISELLELSRIKTRRQKMESIDLVELVEELRGIFEDDLRSKSIELVIDTPLPLMNAERLRMRQIFQNLIDNAIKYMGESATREIHIGCDVHANEAAFYVRDTGIGIDPEDLDKVFLIFRRGRNTMSQNVAGKGVGLASVKSIVETYNGSIWVTSQVGEGSSFRFTINGKFVGQPQGMELATA